MLQQNKTVGCDLRKLLLLFWFCFALFVLFAESAGPSKIKAGKPEETSLDSREKKITPASKSAGGSPRPQGAAQEAGYVSLTGMNLETQARPESCL